MTSEQQRNNGDEELVHQMGNYLKSIISVDKQTPVGASNVNSNKNAPKGTQSRLDLEYGGAGAYHYIEPPIDYDLLISLPLLSSQLKTALDAIVTGIYECGYELVPVETLSEAEREKMEDQLAEEKRKAKRFLDTMDVDGRGHIDLKKRTGWNLELLGNAFWEVVKRPDTGEPYAVQLLESADMKMGDLSDRFIMWEQPWFNGKEWEIVYQHKRWRLFVQVDPKTGRTLYFKELGDPRHVDCIKGAAYTEEEWGKIDPLEVENFIEATEVYHFSLYYPGTPYGMPRWIGALLSILGMVYSEENNIRWFMNGSKADLIISSPYPLSDASIQQIEEYISQSKKMDNARKVILLFPEQKDINPVFDEYQKPVNMQVKEVGQNRDAQFQEYEKQNKENIRTAFRLPPLSVGLSKDFNRATAEVAQEVVEDNVFGPTRQMFDDLINTRLFPDLGIKYIRYQSKPVSRVNKEVVAKILTGIKDGLTVKDMREIGESLLDRPLHDIDLRIKEVLGEGSLLNDLPNILVKQLVQNYPAVVGENAVSVAEAQQTTNPGGSPDKKKQKPGRPTTEETEEETEEVEEETEETEKNVKRTAVII